MGKTPAFRAGLQTGVGPWMKRSPPAGTLRYNERSVADRVDARPKDEFGRRNLRDKSSPLPSVNTASE